MYEMYVYIYPDLTVPGAYKDPMLHNLIVIGKRYKLHDPMVSTLDSVLWHVHDEPFMITRRLDGACFIQTRLGRLISVDLHCE